MSTPQECPGFYQKHNLEAFICKCPNCGKEKEIFADEFKEKHVCMGCGKPFDFSQCTLEYPKFKEEK